jgi:hypothetical protein
LSARRTDVVKRKSGTDYFWGFHKIAFWSIYPLTAIVTMAAQGEDEDRLNPHAES